MAANDRCFKCNCTRIDLIHDQIELRKREDAMGCDHSISDTCHEFVESVTRCADCGKELIPGDQHQKCSRRERANQRIQARHD